MLVAQAVEQRPIEREDLHDVAEESRRALEVLRREQGRADVVARLQGARPQQLSADQRTDSAVVAALVVLQPLEYSVVTYDYHSVV